MSNNKGFEKSVLGKIEAKKVALMQHFYNTDTVPKPYHNRTDFDTNDLSEFISDNKVHIIIMHKLN